MVDETPEYPDRIIDRRSLVLWSVLAACAGGMGCASGAMDHTSVIQIKSFDNALSSGIEWRRLQSMYPDVVAWLSVDKTPISVPVARPGAERPDDWYLAHDLNGKRDERGNPYLDNRSDSQHHMLVYGHHILGSTALFGPIGEAYDPQSFRSIGLMRWYEADRPDRIFTPVMGMQVDQGFQTIQRFSFVGPKDMTAWLKELSGYASAFADAWEQIAVGARTALTLCTCSSRSIGGRERTLLIGVCPDGSDES